MYAVNLADLHTHRTSIPVKMMVLPVIGRDTDRVVCESDRADGMGIILNCGDSQATAIIDIVRQKYHRNAFRFYYSKTGRGWKRV